MKREEHESVSTERRRPRPRRRSADFRSSEPAGRSADFSPQRSSQPPAHTRTEPPITTGALARCPDALTSGELLQQFLDIRGKPLKRLTGRGAWLHRAKVPVLMRAGLNECEISERRTATKTAASSRGVRRQAKRDAALSLATRCLMATFDRTKLEAKAASRFA